MLAPSVEISAMTPWQVIEEALLHRRPARTPQWLADQLGLSIQVVSNWKSRRVPPGRYRQIAELLGLSIDQLEGVATLPWQNADDWPFPDIDRERFRALTPVQLGEIQAEVRRMLTMFERGNGGGGPGKVFRFKGARRPSIGRLGPAQIIRFPSK